MSDSKLDDKSLTIATKKTPKALKRTVVSRAPCIIRFPLHNDKRGELSVIEKENIPFDIKRIYYLYSVPIGAIRGEHGHKNLEQLMVCMNGACNVTLHDGFRSHSYKLDSPNIGLYVPPKMWRSLQFVAANTIICVFASREYEKEDYIFSFEEFIEWTK